MTVEGHMNVRAGKVWLFRIPTFVATILLASQIFPKYAVGAEIGQSNEEWLKTYRAERPTKTTLLEIEDIIKVRGIENELSPILIRASSVSKDDTGSFSVDDKNFTIYGDKIYKFVSRAKFPDAGSDTLHEIAQTNFLLFQYDYTGVNADGTHVRDVEDKLNFGEYNKYYEIQGYFSEFHVGDQMIQRSETLNGYREVRSEVIGIVKGSSFDSRIYGDVIKIINLISTKFDKRYFAENISFINEISYDYWSEYLSYFVKKEFSPIRRHFQIQSVLRLLR